MEDSVHAAHRRLQAPPVRDVPYGGANPRGFQGSCPIGGSNEGGDLVPCREELAHDPASNKARGPRDEVLHLRTLSLSRLDLLTHATRGGIAGPFPSSGPSISERDVDLHEVVRDPDVLEDRPGVGENRRCVVVAWTEMGED